MPLNARNGAMDIYVIADIYGWIICRAHAYITMFAYTDMIIILAYSICLFVYILYFTYYYAYQSLFILDYFIN